MNHTVCQGKQRVVATNADIAAWVVAGAALTDKNVANDDRSATEGFHAQTLAG